MVFEAIAELVAERVEKDISEITMDSKFQDLGIDSLDMVELICDIEDQCEVDFGEPTDLVTIGDIVEHIDSLK